MKALRLAQGVNVKMNVVLETVEASAFQPEKQMKCNAPTMFPFSTNTMADPSMVGLLSSEVTFIAS